MRLALHAQALNLRGSVPDPLCFPAALFETGYVVV